VNRNLTITKVARLVIYGLLLAALPLTIVTVFGSFNLQAASNNSNTLKISPVRSDININPGDSKQVQVTATNLTDQDVSVRPVINDFVSDDERGTPALILDDDQYAPTRSLKRFVDNPEVVIIPAGQSKAIAINISVPETARPGGYFGAVRLTPFNPSGGGQVNLNASVASLILLTVNGELGESLRMTDFYIKKEGGIRDIFHDTDNVYLSVRFENKGDIQLGPFGKIVVMRAGVVVYEVDFNNKNARDMVLPDGARIWDVPLNNISDFGEYTVSAFFTYGQKNQTIEVSKSFWVIPYWLVIIVASASLILIIGSITLVYIYKRKRRYRNMGRSRIRY
jgi:hypothetical protein